MKIKNKGKVYPSPSSSAASTDNRDRDVFSVLKLLPAAILTLASVLSLEDREVLAYMITRSIKTTTNSNPNRSSSDSKKKSSKKSPISNTHHHISATTHKVSIFHCDCFDCYTSYWFRWDSSPNRELIHQVIEAFEDHLNTGEKSRKYARGKRRDKGGRRLAFKPVIDALGRPEIDEIETPPPEEADESSVVAAVCSPDDDVSTVSTPEGAAYGDQLEENDVTAVVVGSSGAVSNHKGLARKLLPDVLGILNSRLWSLWGPNV